MNRLRRCWWGLKDAATIGVPFYVTRRAASGMIGEWTVNGLVALPIVLLLMANALLWPIVGLLTAIHLLF